MTFSLPRKARFFWVYPLVVLMFLTANVSEWSFRIGLVLVLLGEALRVWADGYVGHVKVNSTGPEHKDPKIGQLITSGPYAYVRHPLYVGTLLIGIGFCVIAASLPLAVGALVFFIVVYRKKAKSEEELILEEYGQVYADYCRVVPRWRPALPPYGKRQGQWSWKGIQASQELKTVVWVIVAVLAMYLYEELIIERRPVLGEERLKHVIAIALFVALVLTEGVRDLIRRVRRRPAPPLHPSPEHS